jgi:hypothetical protein
MWRPPPALLAWKKPSAASKRSIRRQINFILTQQKLLCPNPDPINGSSSEHSTSTMTGKWSCGWTVESHRLRRPSVINDQVEFKTRWNGTIEGTGANQYYGKFLMTGERGGHVMVLTYMEQDRRPQRPGVTILREVERNRTIDSLVGRWAQVQAPDTLLWGSARCVPIPP